MMRRTSLKNKYKLKMMKNNQKMSPMKLHKKMMNLSRIMIKKSNKRKMRKWMMRMSGGSSNPTKVKFNNNEADRTQMTKRGNAKEKVRCHPTPNQGSLGQMVKRTTRDLNGKTTLQLQGKTRRVAIAKASTSSRRSQETET